ncbi:hypothetical protein [Nostoc linckia]|nr:hypothetical protein [Nostoc linckia]
MGRWGVREQRNRGDEFFPSAPCPMPHAPFPNAPFPIPHYFRYS